MRCLNFVSIGLENDTMFPNKSGNKGFWQIQCVHLSYNPPPSTHLKGVYDTTNFEFARNVYIILLFTHRDLAPEDSKGQVHDTPGQLGCYPVVKLVRRRSLWCSHACVGKQSAASFCGHVSTTISRPLKTHARLKVFLPAHKIKKRPSVYIGISRMRSSGH